MIPKVSVHMVTLQCSVQTSEETASMETDAQMLLLVAEE
jgi:hypothetical protein